MITVVNTNLRKNIDRAGYAYLIGCVFVCVGD